MKTLFTIAILLALLTGCAVYPAQHPGAHPEVVTNYKWWNNLIEQPVAWVELRNTTPEPFENFTLHVKTYDTKGNVTAAFDIHKPFALPGGSTRGFRVTMPGRNAGVMKVYMVGYDPVDNATDHAPLALNLESER